MKLTFIYTFSPDLSALSKDNMYYTHFELPDSTLQLVDWKNRVIEFVELIGQLTSAYLHVTCKELELKDSLIKSRDLLDKNVGEKQTYHHFESLTILVFKRFDNKRDIRKELRIRCPNDLPSIDFNTLKNPYAWKNVNTKEEKIYLDKIRRLADLCLAFLDSENVSVTNQWRFEEVIPFKVDLAIFKQWKKRQKKAEAETRRREKQAKKMQELQGTNPTGKQSNPSTLKTGGGRRVGAVPGVFQGIQFRSQLEIRFVTQLEAKQVRWVYEGERLGDGNYLVDFYLPDFHCWVEVKGRFEPRDDYLLKDVASFLKKERNERLFVYTQSKAFRVDIDQFRSLTHDEFWVKIMQ